MSKRVPIWATSGWVKRNRAIVAQKLHAQGDSHELGHPTFRDPEVQAINRMFKALKGDVEATALLTHVVSYTHEVASNPPR
jgi:hypothetical protein